MQVWTGKLHKNKGHPLTGSLVNEELVSTASCNDDSKERPELDTRWLLGGAQKNRNDAPGVAVVGIEE